MGTAGQGNNSQVKRIQRRTMSREVVGSDVGEERSSTEAIAILVVACAVLVAVIGISVLIMKCVRLRSVRDKEQRSRSDVEDDCRRVVRKETISHSRV